MIPTALEHLSLMQDKEKLQKLVQVEHYPPEKTQRRKGIKNRVCKKDKKH